VVIGGITLNYDTLFLQILSDLIPGGLVDHNQRLVGIMEALEGLFGAGSAAGHGTKRVGIAGGAIIHTSHHQDESHLFEAI
jgi:hypothetical protein